MQLPAALACVFRSFIRQQGTSWPWSSGKLERDGIDEILQIHSI